MKSENDPALKIEIKDKRSVLDFLVDCRNIHIEYRDNPRWCRGAIGSAKYHGEIAKQYQKCIDIIAGLKEEQ